MFHDVAAPRIPMLLSALRRPLRRQTPLPRHVPPVLRPQYEPRHARERRSAAAAVGCCLQRCRQFDTRHDAMPVDFLA